MKKLLLVSTVLATMLFFSCGNNKEVKEAEEELQEAIEEAGIDVDDSDIKDCDDFLNRYEKWMDDYLDLMEDYMANPMDVALSQKYMALAQEALTWYSQWEEYYMCATREKYQKRFDEIAEKADKRMEELGLDE
jgi:hypothetical protein